MEFKKDSLISRAEIPKVWSLDACRDRIGRCRETREEFWRKIEDWIVNEQKKYVNQQALDALSQSYRNMCLAWDELFPEEPVLGLAQEAPTAEVDIFAGLDEESQ